MILQSIKCLTLLSIPILLDILWEIFNLWSITIPGNFMLYHCFLGILLHIYFLTSFFSYKFFKIVKKLNKNSFKFPKLLMCHSPSLWK